MSVHTLFRMFLSMLAVMVCYVGYCQSMQQHVYREAMVALSCKKCLTVVIEKYFQSATSYIHLQAILHPIDKVDQQSIPDDMTSYTNIY